MRSLFLVFFLFISYLPSKGSKITAYLFPGQGSDERIFSKLQLDTSYRIVYIRYPEPEKNVRLQDFARLVSKQIDTSSPYVFIGVSLGGMICTELSEYMRPEKVIVISSARCRNELPARYRFQSMIPLNKAVPAGMIKAGAKILQPIVEPDRKKEKDTFKSMLDSKSPEFYKRTVNMIINWDRQAFDSSIILIHGANDHTIPIRNTRPDFTIESGSHMMTLTQGEEIAFLIRKILAEPSRASGNSMQ